MYAADNVQIIQPGAVQIPMTIVQPVGPMKGVPPGLEYLTTINHIMVQQQIEILQMLTSWDTNNRYVIRNKDGQQIMFAGEESSAIMRLCCGTQRGFTLHITDNIGREVIRVTRDFRCCGGCACIHNCAHEIYVEAPVGQIIGYARQVCTYSGGRLELLNSNRELVFIIQGPKCCVCECICSPKDIVFNIYSQDESFLVGSLKKKWGGFLKEAFTVADNYTVDFPLDLDVTMKALLIGTTFLIDFLFFEEKKNANN